MSKALAGRDDDQVATYISQLPSRIAAVLITRTEPARAREAPKLTTQAGGRPVLTDEDATAVALTAAAPAYLRHLGSG